MLSSINTKNISDELLVYEVRCRLLNAHTNLEGVDRCGYDGGLATAIEAAEYLAETGLDIRIKEVGNVYELHGVGFILDVGIAFYNSYRVLHLYLADESQRIVYRLPIVDMKEYNIVLSRIASVIQCYVAKWFDKNKWFHDRGDITIMEVDRWNLKC